MKEMSYKLFANQELLSLLSILLLIAIVAWILYKKWIKPTNQEELILVEKSEYQKSKHFNPWQRKDWFWLVLITLMYSVVAVWQLGSTKLPSTYWQPSSSDEFFILEISNETTSFDQLYIISGEGDNNALESGYQIGLNDIQITGSNDQKNWELVSNIEGSSYFQWKVIDGNWNYRYIGVIVKNANSLINEIGLKKTGENSFLPLKIQTYSNQEGNYSPELVIDEQDQLVVNPTYYDQTYFDEIYHVRNAQELATNQTLYSFVHPLLGTQIIGFFINLLGNNPFAWRIGGALFGIMMLPLMYCFGKKLFNKTMYASMATIFLASDFMHLTTSRIATLEPFSIFFIMLMTYFMVEYCLCSFYDTSLKKTGKYLLLSGIAMGIGIAVKWTGAYAAVGLAILFFSSLGCRWLEYKKAKTKKEPSEFEKHIIQVFPSYTLKTILWCVICFVIIPCVIYFVSFIPCQINRGESWSVAAVIKQSVGMYNYHATLQATHPFQSVWWQWILDIRPIWYYHQVYNGLVYTISAFGNPLIWWSGLISIIYCIIQFCRKRFGVAGIIAVCYLTQLVPWLLVTRCVFIYHYYPAVPFLILGLVYALSCLIQVNPLYKKRVYIFVGLCVVLFILFLPATAGFATTQSYINGFMRWLPSWYFG